MQLWQQLERCWVLLGPPGSGKGTYAKLLSKRFGGLHHVSTGDLARRAFTGPEHASLRDRMKAGELLPTLTVVELLNSELRRVQPKAVLLDGFPRTPEQAQLVDEELSTSNAQRLAVQIILHEKHILAKIAGRRVCGTCGAGYNLADVDDAEDKVFMPPILPRSAAPAPGAAQGSSSKRNAAELRCDCGGCLLKREDDDLDVARQRIKKHVDLEVPVANHFQRQGTLLTYKVHRGVGDIDWLSAQIEAHLQSQQVSATSRLPKTGPKLGSFAVSPPVETISSTCHPSL